jgi:type 1 fimbriae regulatory protein FimB/type 1 fimbriae regulatory protein FimE
MAKPKLKLVAPSTVFGGVPRTQPPRKRPNAEVRAREYLTEGEVEKLVKAADRNRHAHRDATLVFITFRHGLRTAEATKLRWDAVDFERGEIFISRAKNGKPGTHPLGGRELRMLRRLKREQTPSSPFVFTTERGAPFTPRGFRYVIETLGKAAGFTFPVHAHMLRHACGYKLANDAHPTRTLQDYLGHRNVQHTVRYTELSPAQFRNLWKD